MPGEPTRAVFLSYASQDAAAARRICDTLRGVGVEVWFDQSELVGGDAWDAKIRAQISSCALFVPVISAHTQARREGYFRIEWRLAAQRTHAMSDDTAFLLPIVIDGTSDSEARVPAEFKAVQWTRLPGGEHADQFCSLVRSLLAGSTPNREAGPAAASAPPGRESRAPAAPPPSATRTPRRGILLGGTLLAALAAAALWWPGSASRPDSVAPPSHPTAPSSTAPVADAGLKGRPTALSPARELVEKARVLYEPWDLATKDDLMMADQFLKRAVELDPTDGEVWAAQALVSCAFVGMNVTAEDRRGEMRLQAERAVKLAPASDNARFARAFAIRLEGKKGAWEEAEPILREVVARNPTHKLMLRCLGFTLANRAESRDEGLAFLQRAAVLPGGDAVAEFNIGQVHMHGRSLPESLAAYNRSLQLAPSAHRTHSAKIELLLRFAGDLPAARQALREVPETVLREDRVAGIAVRVLLANGEPDEALRVLNSTYPYLASSFFNGPTSYLKGLVHRQANRPAAATTEWTIALTELQRRLEANPTARRELVLKAATLAQLGRQAEAVEALNLYEQLVPANGRSEQRVLIVKTLLGRTQEVVTALEEALRSDRTPASTPAFILFEPELAPLRSSPGYAALAENARARFALPRLE